jgi:putative metallohydrolase (TIGR04338 family)
MTQARDTQRQRVYDAERTLAAWRTPLGKRGAMDEVTAFVNEVVGSAWWQKRSSIRTVYRKDGRGRSHAGAWTDWSGQSFVALPAGWARSKAVVLHELAHHLVPEEAAAHGKEFAGSLVALLERFGDPGSVDELKAAYAAQRVRWRGGAPKPDRAPRTFACVECDKAGSRPMPWTFHVKGGGWYRFCTKRCAEAWASAAITRAAPVAAARRA